MSFSTDETEHHTAAASAVAGDSTTWKRGADERRSGCREDPPRWLAGLEEKEMAPAESPRQSSEGPPFGHENQQPDAGDQASMNC